MRALGSVLGAAVVTAIYYVTLLANSRENETENKKKIPYFAWIIGISSFCIMLWLGSKTVGKMSVEHIVTTVMYGILIWGMSVVAVTDQQEQKIPNRILLIMLILWSGCIGTCVILSTEAGISLLAQSFAGGLSGGVIFLLCYLLSKRQLGVGDIKLAFVMGLYLTGQRIIGAVFYGILLCFFYSAVQLLRKRIGLKDGVPLAPFLYGGVLLVLLITL